MANSISAAEDVQVITEAHTAEKKKQQSSSRSSSDTNSSSSDSNTNAVGHSVLHVMPSFGYMAFDEHCRW